MPAVSYVDFSGGLDRRLSINSQDANKLWTLRNAYVTQGKRLKKRPGLFKVNSSMAGSFGLQYANNNLNVFCDTGAVFVAPAGVTRINLDIPPSGGGFGSTVARVLSANVFQGFLYIVAQYADGTLRHHYIDGAATYITDANCPQTEAVTKIASRMWAISGGNVRYCAAGAARDWTTASDAGFIAASLQQDAARTDVKAIGTFQDSLVVLFEDSAQLWSVAEDPAANVITKRMYGTGSSECLSIAAFFNDMVFVSPFGVRSMSVQSTTSRIDDNDVGVPVDSLVVADIATTAAVSGRFKTFGIWLPPLGQYWAVFDMGTYSKVWAYTFSRTSKIACWSEYIFPIRITGITQALGNIFVRDASNLYAVQDTQYTDDGTGIDVEIQMAFQDAKLPGVAKQVWGADMVTTGSWELSFLFDPRDTSLETGALAVSGDTRPGDLLPVEVVAPAIAPVFRHSAAEGASIDALTLLYNALGAV